MTGSACSFRACPRHSIGSLFMACFATAQLKRIYARLYFVSFVLDSTSTLFLIRVRSRLEDYVEAQSADKSVGRFAPKFPDELANDCADQYEQRQKYRRPGHQIKIQLLQIIDEQEQDDPME